MPDISISVVGCSGSGLTTVTIVLVQSGRREEVRATSGKHISLSPHPHPSRQQPAPQQALPKDKSQKYSSTTGRMKRRNTGATKVFSMSTLFWAAGLLPPNGATFSTAKAEAGLAFQFNTVFCCQGQVIAEEQQYRAEDESPHDGKGIALSQVRCLMKE